MASEPKSSLVVFFVNTKIQLAHLITIGEVASKKNKKDKLVILQGKKPDAFSPTI